MKLIKEKVKISTIVGIIIAIIHFVITFLTDKKMFSLLDVNKINYITCKVLLFIILTFFWIFLCDALIGKNKEKKKFLKYLLAYLVPALVILFLIWPGVWYGADIYNFVELSGICEYLYYLNYLTSIFYILGFMIFPCTSGAIILQVVLFAFVNAYIIKNCLDIFKSKWVFLLYIPFLLFHTIFYTYYANRPIMFGILYLFLIMYLIINYQKKENFNNKKLLFISIITAILSVWRNEGIYLIVAIPLFIFIVYKLKINFKNIIKVIGTFIIAFAIVLYPQKNYELKNDTGVPSGRNLPTLIGPLSYMLSRWELKGDNIKEDLANIDKVADIEIMRKYGSFHDTPAMWNEGGCVKKYTTEEYNKFIKSYINVMKNNFWYFFRTKTNTFLSASGVSNDSFTSRNLYSSNEDTILGRKDTKSLVNYKVRKTILNVVEGKFSDASQMSLFNRIIGNLLIPILFIGVIFIYSIFKKNLFWFLLTGMLIGHTSILFFTAPASYFMYYFNVYLCGLIIGIYYIIYFLTKNKLSNKTGVDKKTSK